MAAPRLALTAKLCRIDSSGIFFQEGGRLSYAEAVFNERRGGGPLDLVADNFGYGKSPTSCFQSSSLRYLDHRPCGRPVTDTLEMSDTVGDLASGQDK